MDASPITITYSSQSNDERCFLFEVYSASSFDLLQPNNITSGEYMSLEIDFTIVGVSTSEAETSWDEYYIPPYSLNALLVQSVI